MDAASFRNQYSDSSRPPAGKEIESISTLITTIAGLVRRHLFLFAAVLSFSLFLGLVYLLTTPSRYTAHAMLLIDSSKVRILQQQQAPIGDVPIDTAQVETQLEVLRSETIGLAVIKELKLAENPEFSGASAGLLGYIRGFFSAEIRSEDQLVRKALAAFIEGRKITRVGRTYVLDVGFTSLDAHKSATIANAIADAYIVDQLEAKYQATRRASVWLQDRIKELRQQASDADRAVLEYKEKNKIVEVTGPNSNSPRLLGEQQLQELNTQLGAARAAAAEAKARLVRIDEVMKKDVPDSTVTDSLRNEVITKLRNSYLEIAGKESIWSARYGRDHLAAVNLRTQMAELRRSIVDELGRIAQSYKSDYEIAKARADSLERSLEGLVENSQVINRDRLGLRELESTAQVYHTIYENFLQRYMEAIQQQSFPITEARVISAAAPPTRKSSPISILVLGVSGLLGLIVAFLAAAIREMANQVFRTASQVETLLNLNCLALVPRLEQEGAAIGREPMISKTQRGQSGNSDDRISFLRPLGIQQQDYAEALRKRPDSSQFMNHVLTEPLSVFTEALRSVKMAADVSNSGANNKVIGITSTLAHEGKSTIASNLAALISDAGKSAILLDGDLRNPSLTRALAPVAEAGLLELLKNKADLSDLIYRDPKTGLSFLPSVVRQRLPHSDEVLASKEFRGLVEKLRAAYDYVIIDFPPLAPVVDVRGTTRVVDSFIFVVEWGKTPINLVQSQLNSAPELTEKTLGVILNKANLKLLRRYDANYGKEYYRQYDAPYGYSS